MKFEIGEFMLSRLKTIKTSILIIAVMHLLSYSKCTSYTETYKSAILSYTYKSMSEVVINDKYVLNFPIRLKGKETCTITKTYGEILISFDDKHYYSAKEVNYE